MYQRPRWPEWSPMAAPSGPGEATSRRGLSRPPAARTQARARGCAPPWRGGPRAAAAGGAGGAREGGPGGPGGARQQRAAPGPAGGGEVGGGPEGPPPVVEGLQGEVGHSALVLVADDLRAGEAGQHPDVGGVAQL